MTLHPTFPNALEELRVELESLGMVVVPFGDRLQVRLSSFEHVMIRIDDGSLRCEARLGARSFVKAMWTLVILGAIAIPALLMGVGLTPATLSASFLVLCSLVFNGTRYLLTDGCITRIQQAWLTLRLGARGQQSVGGSGDRPLLGEGALGMQVAPRPERQRERQVDEP